MNRIFTFCRSKSVLAVVGFGAAIAMFQAADSAAAAQAGAAAAVAVKLPSPGFEVAAIKPHAKDASLNGGWGFTADSFSATNLTLRTLILYAYNLKTDHQLRGMPKWGDSDHWDIQARVDSETAEASRKLGQKQRTAEMRLLVQNLLATRFGLKAHRETQELPIYDLVIAKGGSKLAATTASIERSGWSSRNGRISGTGMDAEALAYSLSMCNEVDRIVFDKTGLKGRYDFTLKWTPEDEQEKADSGPSLFTALQDQLGLKLVPAKGPVDTVVVDGVERPSPN
jgi:uncharacterized protein (TIGR03435 family)